MCQTGAVGFSLRIVLVQPRNPLNIGAAARAMANFGFDDLALVEPYNEAWRHARSARAGAEVLERARCYERLSDAIADCEFVVGTTTGSGRVPEVPLNPWAESAAAFGERRCALVFGSEKTGLRVEDISHCQQLARLPTMTGAPSVNLGQAVAVCCYELRRQPPNRLSTEPWAPQASVSERERLVEQWTPLLEHIGVFRPLHRASQTRRLREMLLRWQLASRDTKLLLGVARELRRMLGLSSHRPT